MQTILTRDTLNGMNAGRKASREHIVRELVTIADRHNAMVTRRETPATPGYGGQGIHLEMRCGGVGVMVDINNLHGGFYALAHWFNDYSGRKPGERRGAENFSGRFSSAVGGGIGRPHHKATSCPHDWFGLALCLDAGLYLAARGEAFEAQATEN